MFVDIQVWKVVVWRPSQVSIDTTPLLAMISQAFLHKVRNADFCVLGDQHLLICLTSCQICESFYDMGSVKVSFGDANPEYRTWEIAAAETITVPRSTRFTLYFLCCTAPIITRWLPIGAVWYDVTPDAATAYQHRKNSSDFDPRIFS